LNDLKTWFRSRKYGVEVLTVHPEMPEVIFTDQAVAQIAQLGRFPAKKFPVLRVCLPSRGVVAPVA